jgi:hypothetical protein
MHQANYWRAVTDENNILTRNESNPALLQTVIAAQNQVK